MKISDNSLEITRVMKYIATLDVNPDLPEDGKIEVFSFPINAKRFDTNRVIDGLLESVTDFSLSRKTQEAYSGKSQHLVREAREQFKEWKNNTGELGEFLLFCFLEGHLNAPKILSKLELKTSNKMYVNGSDGVHFLNMNDNRYQLIFGESKLEQNLTTVLKHAFNSIYDFINEVNKDGEKKSGINFERSLISSNLEKETFSEEEKVFLSQLIYPMQNSNAPIVDDSFGIFVGFNFDIEEAQKSKSPSEFEIFIEEELTQVIQKQQKNIRKYITDNDLIGYTFYIYILPFSKLSEHRETILEGLIGQ
ncbi:DUF1837 domain-containing protein [Enterococcus faecalis]